VEPLTCNLNFERLVFAQSLHKPFKLLDILIGGACFGNVASGLFDHASGYC